MKRATFGVGAAVVAAWLLTGCGERTPETASAAEAESAAAGPAVTLGEADVALAVRTTVLGGVPLSGPLSPKVDVTIRAPLAEQVAEMLVDEGEPVRQGQPVARFRDDVLRAAAASAAADVATGRLAVTVAVAESTRAEALFREGAIARRDHETALLATEAARARFALAEAQAASAADRLATATVRAPVSGVVSVRHVQAGDRADFNAPVVSIVDNAVLQLEAAVEAQWLRELRVGRPVRLTVSQLPGDTILGRIARINPTADAATRQVRIYVDVPNGRGRLVGGLFVSGFAVVAEARDAVAVPQAAVRTEGAEQATVVYVIAGGRAARRPVALGLSDPVRGLVQVTRGVAAGDTVVVGPVDALGDGTRVDIAGGGRR
jgi:RND family efflux transporter MFP subunit